MEVILAAPADSAPAVPNPPAGSVQALCPAWKQGHCTGEGWCPCQHPEPTADNGTLPAVGQTAVRATLHYGVAQAWIQDETAHSSVNILDVVNLVAHTGPLEMAMHIRGRNGRLPAGLVVESTGMVPVLGADMVRGVFPHVPGAVGTPAVDHTGVHPTWSLALLQVGNTVHYVAPGARRHP